MSNSKMIMDDSPETGGKSGSGKRKMGLLFGAIILIALLVYIFYPPDTTIIDPVKTETVPDDIIQDSGTKATESENEEDLKQTEGASKPKNETNVAKEISESQVSLENYTIKAGDCLWSIASKNPSYNSGFKWTEIYEMNKEIIKDPDLIYPGQRIKVK